MNYVNLGLDDKRLFVEMMLGPMLTANETRDFLIRIWYAGANVY